MRMIPPKVMICMAALSLVLGCSVKETRELCPCRLELDFSEVDTSVVRRAELVAVADGGFSFSDGLEADAFADVWVEVPRREVCVGVWSGVDSALAEGGDGFDVSAGRGLVIPFGEDCPPVYFHASVVDADCERLREIVLMRKNHCRMTVNVNNVETSDLQVRVTGGVDGYKADGTPSQGEFSSLLYPDVNGEMQVILPRQTDDSLMMEINDGTGVRKSFALGEYVAEAGYDWEAPDLEDITIDIDIAFTHISLVIQGWDTTYEFDVVI